MNEIFATQNIEKNERNILFHIRFNHFDLIITINAICTITMYISCLCLGNRPRPDESSVFVIVIILWKNGKSIAYCLHAVDVDIKVVQCIKYKGSSEFYSPCFWNLNEILTFIIVVEGGNTRGYDKSRANYENLKFYLWYLLTTIEFKKSTRILNT